MSDPIDSADSSDSPDTSAAQASSDYPRAGLWRRLAALLYDGFLVTAIWFLLGYLMQLVFGTGNELVDGQVQTNALQSNLLFALMLASASGFYIWFWTRSGQTLGMIAWRLRAQSVDNHLLSPQQGLVRWLLAWPSFACFGLGFLWLYLDPNGDALHDRWSGSKVVVLPKSHSPFN
ncbi:RDD family protein [Spongiibacter tropicus]|uniref:RDD family protein n=1 Tax=Spongiibacter tropicus TaxID=454602 RepID=UPI0024E20C51|nr:RDD family protein [Spongiibacter tropicus]